jgi:hypothetical protein
MPAFRIAFGLTFMLLNPTVQAQKVTSARPPPASQPRGSVTGHVICSDTQRPARFADVALSRKQVSAIDPNDPKAAKEPATVLIANARTGLDGSFTVHDIPEGDYYAIASLAGYVLPIVPPAAGQKWSQDPSTALANFPVVHVSADRTSQIELTINRGGVITGKVQFDDGAPVSGMRVNAKPAEARDPFEQYLGIGLSQISNRQPKAQTDDKGHYRIVGLSPGKYTIETTIMGESEQQMVGNTQEAHLDPTHYVQQTVTVFAPANFRKSDAETIEIHGDEQHNDTDIQVNLSGLHAISGKVTAGDDHHSVSRAWCMVEDGPDFKRQFLLRADGTFHIDYIPAGTYKLTILSAVDFKPGIGPLDLDEGAVLRSYLPARIQVIVGEHDVKVDDIALTEVKARKDAN